MVGGVDRSEDGLNDTYAVDEGWIEGQMGRQTSGLIDGWIRGGIDGFSPSGSPESHCGSLS